MRMKKMSLEKLDDGRYVAEAEFDSDTFNVLYADGFFRDAWDQHRVMPTEDGSLTVTTSLDELKLAADYLHVLSDSE